VLFSEQVLRASLLEPAGLTLTRVSTGETVVGQLAIAGSAVAFVPGAALIAGETYRFAAGTDIEDLSGHPLATATTSTFTVAASGTGAPPVLDPLPSRVCATELTVKGSAAAGARIRVRDGGLSYSGIAGTDGRFSITVPLAANGFHLLHVVVVGTDGSVASREAVVLVQVDCSAPTVQAAAFDRTTGIIAVTFSEAMNAATVTVGDAAAAIQLTDANDSSGTPQSGAVSFSSDGTVASIQLSTDPSAWWREKPVRLRVGPPAADAQGNVLAVAFETVFFPSGSGGLTGGFLSGEAYDDATGRPLAGARVRLFASGVALPGAAPAGSVATPFAETTTDGRGRYTIAGDVIAGRYVVVIEKDGYNRVVRRLALEPVTGVVAFDARLTPRSAATPTFDPLAGGTVDGPTGTSLVLAVNAGAITASGPLSIQITPLGGQGLPDFLPLGWTPAAVAEVALANAGGTLPEGAATPFASAGVTLTVPLPSWLLPTDTLRAVRYDLPTGTWLTLAAPEILSGNALARVTLDGPGTIALVTPDEVEATKPPIPTTVGVALLGTALPEAFPPLAATFTLDPPVVPPTGRAAANVLARSTDDTTVWPSGLAVQAFIEERLHLADGGQLLEAPFSADLLLYHPRLDAAAQGSGVAGSVGAMVFNVSPSPRASQVILDVGWENIRLFAFPDQIERGQILGPAGGTVTGGGGIELSLPEGALTSKFAVKAEPLSAAELASLPPVAGYQTLAGTRIDLAGQTLARAATVRLPVPAGTPAEVAGDPRIVLAELIEAPADGRGTYPGLVSRASRVPASEGVPERIVAAPEPAGSLLPLSGLVHEGLYLVLHANDPIGFATGFVRAQSGYGLTGARVTAAGLGTADVSGEGGRYSTVAAAGNTTLTALAPSSAETSSANVSGLAPGGIVEIDIVIRPVPPTIVELLPTNGAVDQPVGSTPGCRFSEPIDATSVGAATITLELADGFGKSAGVYISGKTELAEDRIHLVFLPTYPLPPGRTFIATFHGGVRDVEGTFYAGAVPVVWTFGTSMVVAPGGQVHPEKFHIRMPVNGRADIYGEPGALPLSQAGEAYWAVTPEVEGKVADTTTDTFQADKGNGSFEGYVGHPATGFPVTIASKVWVKVLDPQGSIAAHFRLGPFTTPDGKGFVAPPGEAVSYTTPEGIVVDVPADAFDVATPVTITTLDPATIGVPTPAGVALGAYINVDFEGEARETLRLKLPAPPDAQAGALVIAATPVDFPWGRRLQMLDIGEVIEENGEKFISNDPFLQPEPEPASGGSPALGREGAQKAAWNCGTTKCGTSTQGECADKWKRRKGLSKCFMQEVFMEMSARTTAAWFYEAGAELALASGGVAPGIMAGYSAVMNAYADTWVYVPRARDWNGKYVLPVPTNAPYRLVVRDLATGWLIAQKDFDAIAPGTTGVVTGKYVGNPESKSPLLVSAKPFDLVRFRTPPKDVTYALRLEADATADDKGMVTIKPRPSYPFADGTRLELYDYGPATKPGKTKEEGGEDEGSKDVIEGPKPPPACGGSFDEISFKGSHDLVLLVLPGDLDASRVTSFDFNFDRPIESLKDVDPKSVATLEDLGERDGCEGQKGSGYPRELPILIEQYDANALLRIKPVQQLAAGHRYKLKIEPGQIKAEGGDESGGGVYSNGSPKEFLFATRKVEGEVIGSSESSLGSALDMMQFGNLMMVTDFEGHLFSVDTSDLTDEGRFKPYSSAFSTPEVVRGLSTDGHNRLFFAGRYGSVWGIKAVAMEDVREAKVSCAEPAPHGISKCFPITIGSAKVAHALGFNSGLLASEWLSLGAMPEGTPMTIHVEALDEVGKTLPAAQFLDTYQKQNIDDLPRDERGLIEIKVNIQSTKTRGGVEPSMVDEPGYVAATPPTVEKVGCGCEPESYHFQRATLDNVTTGQSWSVDLEESWPVPAGGAPSQEVTLKVHRNDLLRVRYNLRAYGYVAIMGSGVSVVDLNRFYRTVPQGCSGGQTQCGRLLGQYQGQDIEWPDCACPGDTGSNCRNAFQGIDMTPSVVAIGPTGGGTRTKPKPPATTKKQEEDETEEEPEIVDVPRRGEERIHIFSPRVRTMLVHSRSPQDAPGDVVWVPEDQDDCLKVFGGLSVTLRDVQIYPDAHWIDNGVTGNLKGSFSAGEKPQDRDKWGDLLFVSLGKAGIMVVDVSDRELKVIGHLIVNKQTAQRLQLDLGRGWLYAGGVDEEAGKPVIQIWDVRAVNSAPTTDYKPQPIASFNASWTTNHIGVDQTGLGLIWTWSSSKGVVAVPFAHPQFVFAGVYRLEKKEDEKIANEVRPRPALERATTTLLPLGTAALLREPTDESELKDKMKRIERQWTGVFKVRVALPGGFGEELTAKVQALRALPDAKLLGKEDVDMLVGLPGGPGWPGWDKDKGQYLPEVVVTLKRLGDGEGDPGELKEDGKFSTAYQLYESKQTIVLLSDPRAKIGYKRQDGEGEGEIESRADEKAQCRNCRWPEYLPDPEEFSGPDDELAKDFKELLAGGPYIRVFLSDEHNEPGTDTARANTSKAIAFFEEQEDNYRFPSGYATLLGYADDIPSPVQASGAEPPLNAAIWAPGEAGVAASMAAGDALLTVTDYVTKGRGITFEIARNYRSGTLAYGVFGAAGWHGALWAHLRENGLTGEVEYHDGQGDVYRYIPKDRMKEPPEGYEKDEQSQYHVQKGLYLRLQKLAGGSGFRLVGPTHATLYFDAAGRLMEKSDRLRQANDANKQGNTIRHTYDAAGQLVAVEDDYGRVYTLEYLDDPKPAGSSGDGFKYGLLEKIKDFVDREIEYRYGDDDRLLSKVVLPKVDGPGYSFDEPTVEYAYVDQVFADKAVAHGDDFSKLRLESYKLPGASVERVKLVYDDLGRIDEVVFPEGAKWKLGFEPSGSAGPVETATATTPWAQEIQHNVEKGRFTEINYGASSTKYEYLDDDTGRLKMLTQRDQSELTYEYKEASDRLQHQSVVKVTHAASGADQGTADYGEIVLGAEHGEDNLPETVKDGLQRAIKLGVPYAKRTVEAGYLNDNVQASSEIDPYGRPKSISTIGKNPLEIKLGYKEDAKGNIDAGYLKSLEAGTVKEDYEYDDAGNKRLRTTNYGREDKAEFDEWDRPHSETKGIGSGLLRDVSAKFERAYDEAGHLVLEKRLQTGLGEVEKRFTYNDREQLTSITQTGLASEGGDSSAEGTKTFTYDGSTGLLSSVESAGGIVTNFTYDSQGRIETMTRGVSGTREFTYDDMDRVVTATDGDAGRWTRKYDAWGRLYREDLPTLGAIEIEYDAAGNKVRESGLDNGATLSETLYHYNSMGKTEWIRQLAGAGQGSIIYNYTYDGSGRVNLIEALPTIGLPRTQTIEYEAASGRLDFTIDGVGNVLKNVYTGSQPWPGQTLLSEYAPEGMTSQILTTLGYDAFGRVVNYVRGGTTVDHVLDELGNVLSTTVGGTVRTTQAYDSAGKTLSVEAPDVGRKVSYGYDKDGRLRFKRVPKQSGGDEETSFVYDGSGRLEMRTRPGSSTELFDYYPDDQVWHHLTRLGLNVRHTYDAANRLTDRIPLGEAIPGGGLAPVDGGDRYSYDVLSRPLSVGRIVGDNKIEASSAVTYSEYDLRSLPRFEKVGLWPSSIGRTFDDYGNPIAVDFPEELAGSDVLTGFGFNYDELDRVTSVSAITGVSDPVVSGLGANLVWTGKAKPLRVTTLGPGGVTTAWGYDLNSGRLNSLQYGDVSKPLGGFCFIWDETNDRKLKRLSCGPGSLPASESAAPSGISALNLLAGEGELTRSLDWVWGYSGGDRLETASTGLSGAIGAEKAAHSWSFSLGIADELMSVTSSSSGHVSYTSGPNGRILTRTDTSGEKKFSYDGEGRRIEDDHARMIWDWRGLLVQIDLKTGEHAGERVVNTYDAIGRLLTWTHLGQVPAGGTDEQRPFIAKRALVWNGQALLSEAGLNYQDHVVWRRVFVPGHTALNDSPQMLVEAGLQTATPTRKLYAFLRDESNSVVGILEDAPENAGASRLLGRVMYTPYGEARVERGPEPTTIEHDVSLRSAGGQSQTTTPGLTVPGGIRITTTSPLASPTLPMGVSISVAAAAGLPYEVANPGDFLVATADEPRNELRIVPSAGWRKGSVVRITLSTALADEYGRSLRFPSGQSALDLRIEVPGDSSSSPVFAQTFTYPYDTAAAAADTFDDAFPGGQNQLFQGQWTDPVSGFYYSRARWYDPANSAWLSEDPKQDVDSPNVYAFVGWKPHLFTDPLGTETLVVAYGRGYLSPESRGAMYDVGRQFQLAAETRARELQDYAKTENEKRIAAGKAGAELVYVEGPTLVSNRDEFTALLNKSRSTTGPIKQLHVFSHGWTGGINLGGTTEAENEWTLRNFTIGELASIRAGIFALGAAATFYGCHTADPSGNDYNRSLFNIHKPFAQAFADTAGIRVTGFISGSHFEYRGKDAYQVPDIPGQVVTFPTPPPPTPPAQPRRR
jgi:RHS repeat-associated protein